ncbi:BnaC06g43290D [Brassica napus]|nr:unnamed protein product [Brassica napus]CDY61330.1 BnaC06g43290D [Brassica napus]VDD63094.1 unnamed protein product [Brassica oleracea]
MFCGDANTCNVMYCIGITSALGSMLIDFKNEKEKN